MNHTPGPWKVAPSSNPKNGTAWRDLHAPSQFGDMYIGEALEKDAEFIVLACNAHKELVALLDDAVTGRHTISPDWYTRASTLIASLKKGA